MAEQAKLWTLAALAVELGRDRMTVGKMIAGLAADGKRGQSDAWLMKSVFNWLMAKPVTDGADRALDATLERARKDAEMADKLALANALTRGEQIKITDVERVWADIANEVKTKMLSIPTKSAPLLADRTIAEIEDLLKRDITDALERMSEDSPSLSGGTATAAAPQH